MKTIIEPKRETPVYKECDVAVIGGGPAGFAASVAAARNGAKTVLIEQYGCLGGMMTGGGLHVLLGFFAKHRQVVKGIAQEIVDRLGTVEHGTLGHQRRDECDECTPTKNCMGGSAKSFLTYDPEALKPILLSMAVESGVEILLHTMAVDSISENDSIRGVIIESKSGRQAVLAEVVVDATGDGDIAARAGAPYEKGRQKDGMMQSPSLVFRIDNVKRDDKRIHIRSEELQRVMFLYRLPRKGQYSVNADSPPTEAFKRFDATNAESLTEGEILSRTNEVARIVEFLRKNIEGCESCFLASTPTTIGVRETRRIMGEYVLTREDIVRAAKFEDGVVNGVHLVDVHMLWGIPFSGGGELPCDQHYNIPYRCLVPKKIDHLLMAGRCISTTREANGSVRVMVQCISMGEAAGTAAALSVKKGVNPRNLDVELLRETLVKNGCVL